MGLSSSLQIGRTGLMASQTALETAGNNLANIATEGYHRQTVTLAPNPNREILQNIFIGTGVHVEAITRQIDEALESRLRSAISEESRSLARQELLEQIEVIENEFSDVDLSTRLNLFFNAWDRLAGNPQDNSLRTLVTSEAGNLSSFIRDVRDDLSTMRSTVESDIRNNVNTVDDLLERIENLNTQIAVQDQGTGGASGLRDQRDVLLTELAQYFDISTVEQANGSVDVFVGSLPIIINGQSRGVDYITHTIDGELRTDVVIADDESILDISSGKIGALVEFKNNDLEEAITTLDTFTNQLIFEVNKLHSSGRGLDLVSSVTGTGKVEDATLSLNDPDTYLDFTPTHGSFQVHVIQKSTGQRMTTTVTVDLDGINPAADTTLNSLTADIDAIANISASVTSAGELEITADSSDYEFCFSEDSSGALAALGINTFFTGGDALDIRVNPVLSGSPRLIAVSADPDSTGDNTNALAISALRGESISGLNNLSLSDYWSRHVETYAVRLSQAKEEVTADAVVREALQTQQQAYSGVNADEETINLIQFLRAFQASARFITVVDELMQTLISMA